MEQALKEVVLGGEGLVQEAGEEEEHLLRAQLLVLVQGLPQALEAPGGTEV